MSRYTLYSEIRKPLKAIEKSVLTCEDGYAESTWADIKEQIDDLATACINLAKERKQRDREEAAEFRAFARQTAKEAKSGEKGRQTGMICPPQQPTTDNPQPTHTGDKPW